MNRKRRSLNQIKEDISFHILREKLPETWVIHEYGPDYGIDCVIELFDYVDEKKTIAETLGEIFFIQLKASASIEYTTKKVYPRSNVEKGKLCEDKSDSLVIEVAKFQLEVSELLTVQSMGAATPVLLVLVDINTDQVFFVCLNDYIEKVLIPEDRNFMNKDSKTIYIPVQNEILNCRPNLVPLRVYGKRSKMYASFGKFAYQQKEVSYIADWATHSDEGIRERGDTIAFLTEIALQQPIWNSHDFWEPIQWSRNELLDLRAKLKEELSLYQYLELLSDCYQVWQHLNNLGSMYEEIVREWYMPTFLAQITSYNFTLPENRTKKPH